MNRIAGFNDEVTECDRCGRADLRGTGIVLDENGTEIGRFGSDCVATVVTGRWTQKKFQEVEARRTGEFRACINYGTRVLLAGHADIARRQAAIALNVAMTEAERTEARNFMSMVTA